MGRSNGGFGGRVQTKSQGRGSSLAFARSGLETVAGRGALTILSNKLLSRRSCSAPTALSWAPQT